MAQQEFVFSAENLDALEEKMRLCVKAAQERAALYGRDFPEYTEEEWNARRQANPELYAFLDCLYMCVKKRMHICRLKKRRIRLKDYLE